MHTLSLFDGMACGALAMQAAEIGIDSYNAYEIDKYAIKTANHNFPFIKQHGDVTGSNFAQFEGVDIVCGGSPCTYWSIAQKNNRETEASGMGWDLFQQYARAVKEAKPKYFIYENNKSMSNAIKESISDTFGFEPIHINSALVSAQNRQRYYWVGMRKPNGGYTKINIELPEDRGILLRDILESGIPFRSDKACCLDACYYKGGNMSGFNRQSGKRLQVAEPIRIGDIGSTTQAHRVYSCDGKSVTINAGGGGQGGKTGLYLCPSEGGTKATPIYEVRDGFINHNGQWYPIKLADGFYIIRKLTVRECARLQTVPEWYCFPVSDTQAYKMLGNGWTVDVIAHLMRYIKVIEAFSI